MKILCKTNIDCAKGLKWPTELPGRPMVGDMIRSDSSTWSKVIELEVCSCTWVSYGGVTHKEPYLEVDLHLPKFRYSSIKQFEEFVKRPAG